MAQRAIIKLAFGHQADSFLSASHKSVSQEVVLPFEAEKFGEEETFIFVASSPGRPGGHQVECTW